jgi:alkylhydroperoxidase/carboxymuconolactone decarboxylase family protein YurZ
VTRGGSNAGSDYRALAQAVRDAAWVNPALSERQKHLILLSEAAALASRDPVAVAEHVAEALRLGCSEAEILEVAELASVLPIHACTEGMPVLARVAGRAVTALEAGFDIEQVEERVRFEHARGYWSDFWTVLLNYDRRFFAAYTALSSRAWNDGVLEPYLKELIYLGFDASPKHLYRPGIEIHARNALALGASEQQVANVFTLLGCVDTGAFELVAAELAQRAE